MARIFPSLAELIEPRDEAKKIALESYANDAGLRAVIRYLLAELRKTQPNHPLLDYKNRDRIFDEFHKEDISKALKANSDCLLGACHERRDRKFNLKQIQVIYRPLRHF